MWDRTLTVSSAGKTFSCTGWKVGWIYGPAPLINPIMLANQWVQFSVSTPAQRAMVEILEVAEQPYGGCESYYEYLRQMYEGKRNHLVETLRSVGLTPVVPQGGFFAMANTSQIRFPDQFLEQPLPNGSSATRDWGFARWLTIEVGVTPIPPTSFYSQDTRHLGENLGSSSLSPPLSFAHSLSLSLSRQYTNSTLCFL
jgi:aspartate/methionine/tyrosine aminotransferase